MTLTRRRDRGDFLNWLGLVCSSWHSLQSVTDSQTFKWVFKRENWELKIQQRKRRMHWKYRSCWEVEPVLKHLKKMLCFCLSGFVGRCWTNHNVNFTFNFHHHPNHDHRNHYNHHHHQYHPPPHHQTEAGLCLVHSSVGVKRVKWAATQPANHPDQIEWKYITMAMMNMMMWIGLDQYKGIPIPIRQTILTVMTQMRQKCKWQNEDTRHYYDEENVGWALWRILSR